MPIAEYNAYSQWIDKWWQHVLYGTAAIDAELANEARRETTISDLPGGKITRVD